MMDWRCGLTDDVRRLAQKPELQAGVAGEQRGEGVGRKLEDAGGGHGLDVVYVDAAMGEPEQVLGEQEAHDAAGAVGTLPIGRQRARHHGKHRDRIIAAPAQQCARADTQQRRDRRQVFPIATGQAEDRRADAKGSGPDGRARIGGRRIVFLARTSHEG